MQSFARGVVRLSVFGAILLGAILPTFAFAQYYPSSNTCGMYINGNWNYNCNQQGVLTVFVQVNNQNGTSRAPSDFTMYVSGANVSQQYFAGSQNGTNVQVSGSYNVSLYNSSDYTPTYSSGCAGTMNQGQTNVCYVTLNSSYNNNTYPYNYNYPPQYQQPVVPVTYVQKYIPSLPNTGFGPVDTTALSFALAVLLVVLGFFYPYVRKAFAVVLR